MKLTFLDIDQEVKQCAYTHCTVSINTQNNDSEGGVTGVQVETATTSDLEYSQNLRVQIEKKGEMITTNKWEI